MALSKTNSRFTHRVVLGTLAIAVAIIVVVAFIMLRTAQGSDPIAGETVGIGSLQSTHADPGEAGSVDKLEGDGGSAESIEADDLIPAQNNLAKTSSRSITVKDPDPVVAFAAVDSDNPNTVAKALQVGCLEPLPTAPRILPDVAEPGWLVGAASAYDLENNDGWDATASGVKLHRYSITVAVPISQSYLLGSAVEIVYGDKVVVATVTDTGGFEPYGRALDLAGGVWRALGAESCDDWGVRRVHYRFL